MSEAAAKSSWTTCCKGRDPKTKYSQVERHGLHHHWLNNDWGVMPPGKASGSGP
jgi:hypothetical protein